MNQTFAKWKAAFSGLAIGAALFAAASGAQAERVIKVATEPTFPPFEFVDTKTGEISGFEMELVRAIGKEMGAKIDVNIAGNGTRFR